MKQFISILLALVLFGSTAKAQTWSTFPVIAGDTLNNADTVTKSFPVTAGYSVMGIQVNLKKISGTVAGKAYLFRSSDGVSYQLIDSASYTAVPTGSMFSTTVTNVAQFEKPYPSGGKYLVNAVSSGSVSARVTMQYVVRRYD